MIPLPADFVSSILTNVGTLLADFSPYVVLILSVIFIGVILEILIGALRR
jgi:hypothetical protein